MWQPNLNRDYKSISDRKKSPLYFYHFSLGLFYSYVYNRISVNLIFYSYERID